MILGVCKYTNAIAVASTGGLLDLSIVIARLLEKLTRLEECVRGLRGYRFYAASLLMCYDGDVKWTQGTQEVFLLRYHPY